MTNLRQNFRWLVRDLALLPLKLPGVSTVCRKLGANSAIISFHNVLPLAFDESKLIHNVDVRLQTFEDQLTFLLKHYNVRPASDIYAYPDQQGIILSVDDGLLNNAHTIAPILKKLGLTAIFAVCPALIDRTIRFLWRDWLYLGIQAAFAGDEKLLAEFALKDSGSAEDCFRAICPALYCDADPYKQVSNWIPEPERFEAATAFFGERFLPMSWEQIANLNADGHIIASHTMTHRPLANLTDDELREELSKSKSRISQKLGEECRLLVFPYGTRRLVDERSFQLAKECGYEMALMNIRNTNDSRFSTPRFGLPNTTSNSRLLASVSGLHEWLRR